MQVGQSTLLDLFAEQVTRFTIPAYQRRYAWQQRQCEELWLDVLRAARRGERHFSGTVLYEETDEAGMRTLSIVDGQQRITTVMLMLVALRNYLSQQPEGSTRHVERSDNHIRHVEHSKPCGFRGEDALHPNTHSFASENSKGVETSSRPKDASYESEDHLSPSFIDDIYLTITLPDGSRAPKLQLSRLDAASMKAAVDGSPTEDIPSRNIANNLAYFQNLMAGTIDPDGKSADDRANDEDAATFDPELFMQGLSNLVVVMARLEPEDDAQAVFESLNSKGLKLNIGDMVRNYLLASESHDDQTRLYIEYWTVIEGVFDPDPGSLKLDTMIKAWLSVRFTKVRARTPEDVYSAFKRYYDDEYSGDLEPVLNELRSFSMVWAENYRYHAVKKFRSMPWAQNGAQTLTSGYELKKANNEEYAERVRAELRAMGRDL